MAHNLFAVTVILAAFAMTPAVSRALELPAKVTARPPSLLSADGCTATVMHRNGQISAIAGNTRIWYGQCLQS